MEKIVYKIADTVFTANIKFSYTRNLMSEFEYHGDEEPELEISIPHKKLKNFSSHISRPTRLSEHTYIFKKLGKHLVDFKRGMFFHASAIAFGGNGVLFAALSGTGKSTHARMWRETFDDVEMINDDKPIILLRGDKAFVCGTPWKGKHSLGSNKIVELKAICFIERAKECSVVPFDKEKAVSRTLMQILRYPEIDTRMKCMNIMSDLFDEIPLLLASVDISHEAAKVCRAAITEVIGQ